MFNYDYDRVVNMAYNKGELPLYIEGIGGYEQPSDAYSSHPSVDTIGRNRSINDLYKNTMCINQHY